MKREGRGEEGIALLVVLVLMGVMLSTGFAIMSTIDVQTRASKTERVRDAAFNLAESALNAQIFRLTTDWPGPGRSTVPYTPCTAASTTARCPDKASLLNGTSSDLNPNSTWTTSVRDNGATGAPSFYSDTVTQGQPGYDAAGGPTGAPDGKLWVRAQATANGRTRTLVALVTVEKQEEDIPHGALIAGSLDISNNGNKELIHASGGPVAVRCDPAANPNASCLGHPMVCKPACVNDPLLQTQITGATPTGNYASANAMTPEALGRLKATAIANGTYYSVASTASCPTDAQLTGPVVYLESATNVNCFYSSNARYNSLDAPGALILDHTSITFGGNTLFWGVIYGANTVPGASVVTTQGNSALINGGVILDGTAKMTVGSSGLNINFDVNAYRAVASYGSAGIVQNTWREITSG